LKRHPGSGVAGGSFLSSRAGLRIGLARGGVRPLPVPSPPGTAIHPTNACMVLNGSSSRLVHVRRGLARGSPTDKPGEDETLPQSHDPLSHPFTGATQENHAEFKSYDVGLDRTPVPGTCDERKHRFSARRKEFVSWGAGRGALSVLQIARFGEEERTPTLDRAGRRASPGPSPRPEECEGGGVRV
jgi:hypothetical protein